MCQRYRPALEERIPVGRRRLAWVVLDVNDHWHAVVIDRPGQDLQFGTAPWPGRCDRRDADGQPLSRFDPGLGLGTLDVVETIEVVRVAVRDQNQLNRQRIRRQHALALTTGRHVAGKQLVVSATDERRTCLVVRIRGCSSTMPSTRPSRTSTALFGPAERPSLHRLHEGPVEQFERPHSTWRAPAAFVQDLHLCRGPDEILADIADIGRRPFVPERRSLPSGVPHQSALMLT